MRTMSDPETIVAALPTTGDRRMMGRTEYEIEIIDPEFAAAALAAIDRKLAVMTSELTALGVEAP